MSDSSGIAHSEQKWSSYPIFPQGSYNHTGLLLVVPMVLNQGEHFWFTFLDPLPFPSAKHFITSYLKELILIFFIYIYFFPSSKSRSSFMQTADR